MAQRDASVSVWNALIVFTLRLGPITVHVVEDVSFYMSLHCIRTTHNFELFRWPVIQIHVLKMYSFAVLKIPAHSLMTSTSIRTVRLKRFRK